MIRLMKRSQKKGYHLLFFILSFLILSVTQSIALDRYDFNYSKKSLTLESKVVYLDTPIIVNSDVYFIPLQDVVTVLKGKVRYNRRSDTYNVALPRQKKTLNLRVNTKEVWVNDTQQFLINEPVFYNGRFYVPVKSFFSLLNYSSEINDTGITVTKSESSLTYHHQMGTLNDDHNITIVSSLNIDPPPINTSFLYPRFEEYDNWFIQVDDRKFDMSQNTIYEKRDIYIKAEPFFKSQGFNVVISEQTMSLEKEFVKFEFDLHSLNAKLMFGHNESEIRLSQPIILRGRELYIPLISMIDTMGFTPVWNQETATLSLLKNLRHIRVIKDDVDFKLQLFSNQGLVSVQDITSLIDQNNNDLSLKIPLTQIDKMYQLKVPKSPISKIQVSKLSQTEVKLLLSLRERVKVPNFKRTEFGSELSFKTIVEGLSHEKRGQNMVFTVSSNGPFTYKSWYENNMFIVDIPDAVSHLPQIIRSQHPNVKKIRTSQLSRDPLKTRLVFHLNKRVKIQKNRKDPKTLELILPYKKTFVTKKPIKPILKSGLANRIIFIDPGHGGNDPGAVVQRNIYEKKYTLDISKRLKRKLEAAGADVVMARSADQNPSLRRRVVLANRNKVDAFISVHLNSFTQPVGRGTETYYYKRSEKRLAQSIHKQLVKNLKRRNNGLKRTGFYVLRYSKMPSVLIEPMFMTNPKELELIKKPETREKIAQSIYDGLANYFN